MNAHEVLDALLRVNLAAGAAIVVVIVLRKAVRLRFGARLAYGLWLLPALAATAVLVPARQVVLVLPSATPVIAQTARVHDTFASPAHAAVAVTAVDPLTLLMGLWLVGVAAAALIMAFLQHRFLRQARRGAVGPAVVGVITPQVITPRDFAERYSRDEQALVLAHEQAHIARHDSRLNGLSAAVQCLCWFNPLAHLGAHLMRVDQELACDEAVVSRFPNARRAYAEVLLKAHLAILPLPLGCYWPSKTRHPLVERVAMLKRKDVGRRRRRAGAAALAILCAGSGLAAWAAQPADVRIAAIPVRGAGTVRPGPDKIAAGDADHRQGSPGTKSTAQGSPPAGAAVAGDFSVTVKRVVIEGPQWIEEGKVRAELGITPGQTVTKATLAAAGNRLSDGGLISAMVVKPGGDLVVRVKMAPTPIAQGHGEASADRAVERGAIAITADSLDRRDERSVRYAGHVEVVSGGNHLMSDVLDVTFPDKVTVVFGESPPPNPPTTADSPSNGPSQMIADGHVSYLSDHDTVEADHAVYDLGSGTVTLNGHVVVVQGPALVKNDKLILEVNPTSVIPGQTGPSTENAIRRWIAAVQLHQIDEADMSPALILAARQQDTMTTQTFRAFGPLQSVRFVRAMPEGDAAYEADFAHGKLEVLAGPLTADGKLDQLRWRPIWAKAGARPQPGLPLAP